MTTRIDKWIWAIRLFKTRTDATEACRGGRVKLNGESVKPSANVRPGDQIEVRGDRGMIRIVEVTRLIDKRVGAAVAAGCFIDHSPPPPIEPRVAQRQRGSGRPTKRERRELDRLRRQD